jgi:hypothetical protein
VRNLGKTDVKFEYVKEVFEGRPFQATDGDGMSIPQGKAVAIGGKETRVPVTLRPSEEILLFGKRIELKPGNKVRPHCLMASGNVSLWYERLFGSTTSGNLDPKLSELATGKLELEITSDRPALGKESGQRQLPPVSGKDPQRQVVWKRLGVELTPVDAHAVNRVDKQLRGGMAVTSIHASGVAAKAGIKKGDILVGLHIWETVSLENVAFVLDHPDLETFNPVSYTIIRRGNIRKGHLGVPASVEPGDGLSGETGGKTTQEKVERPAPRDKKSERDKILDEIRKAGGW